MNVAIKLPRQLTLAPVDFAPRARSCPHHGTCESPELCDGYKECKLDHTIVQAPPVDLDRLETDIARKPLDEIAAAIRKLTYSEMMEFADGLWNQLPSSPPVTPEEFPKMLHQWSTQRK